MSSLTPDVLSKPSPANDISISTSSLQRGRPNPVIAQQQTPASPNPINNEAQKTLQHDYDPKHDKTKSRKTKEVYRFQTEWLVSSVAWSNELDLSSFDLALSSYLDDYTNRIQIVSLTKDDYDESITSLTSFDHPYPATKILWTPRSPNSNSSQLPRLIATTSDYLRLWRFTGSSDEKEAKNELKKQISIDSTILPDDNSKFEVKLESFLNSNKETKQCAPLTSFDWNETDPRMIVTSSVDTTCAIWDIEVSKVMNNIPIATRTLREQVVGNLRSQIVAHNQEVYDVSFSRSGSGRDVFVSAGGDGSIRLFDLRRLATSTMLYNLNNGSLPSDKKAFVRVCCNKQDANYVSAFTINSNEILLLDTRQPGRPLVVLNNHSAPLNSISWAPHSAHYLCSASDDCQALIWELSKLPASIEEPLLAYRANGKINAISWSASHPDWIAIGFENHLELLRV